VFNEITQSDKPFSAKLEKFTKSKKKTIKNKMALSVLSHELDQGESEAIILALENNIEDILIDEQKGRKIAAANGLHPIGTIGILIQAKKLGLIKHIKPLLDLLICNNIRISNGLYNLALNLAKES
jgi:predicted nucleic acid-binding protein